MQPRVAGVGVLELALERELRLAGEVADALGPAAVVGREVVLGQPLRQRAERGGPPRPRLPRDVGHQDGWASSTGKGANSSSVRRSAMASASIGWPQIAAW